ERRRAPEVAGEAHDLHRLRRRMLLDRAREQALHRAAVLAVDVPWPAREARGDQLLAVPLIDCPGDRPGVGCVSQGLLPLGKLVARAALGYGIGGGLARARTGIGSRSPR